MHRPGSSISSPLASLILAGILSSPLGLSPQLQASCVVTCSVKSAPLTGTTEEAVEFEVETESHDCTGQRQFLWAFGDGQFSEGTNKPRHLYTRAGSFDWSVRVTEGTETCTRIGRIVITSPCPPPGRPEIDPDSATVVIGQKYTINWSKAEALQNGGTYTLEISKTNAFVPLEQTVTLSGTSYLYTIPQVLSESKLYVRVRAVQPCGTAGQNSGPLVLSVQAPPSTTTARFAFTRPGPSWVVERGAAPPEAEMKVRNLGQETAQITFTATGGFFAVSPSSLTLRPGEDGELTLRATPASVAVPGFSSGTLEGLSGNSRIATPVTLQVTGGSGDVSGVGISASAKRLTFSAPKGANPPPQTVKLRVGPLPSGGTVYLSPSIGPGGTWLVLDPAAFANPVPPSGEVTLNLSVDRSKRTREDGLPPLRTFLKVSIAGGRISSSDAAVVEVLDIETPNPAGSAGGGRPAGTDSLILPVVVRSPGLRGALYMTDGWIRNIGAADVTIDLYWTPLEADGRKDDRVLKTAGLLIPAGQTLQLSDMVQSAFGLSEGTGLVEIRSSSLDSLIIRSSVQSTLGEDNTLRFSGAMEPVTGGEGVGAGDGRLRLSWVQSSETKRYNVQVSETAGAAAQGLVEVFDQSGKKVGQSIPFTVAPLSVTALTGIVDRAEPGRVLDNGFAEVRVTQGEGKVVARGQLLDNVTNSFASFSARLVAPISSTGGKNPKSPAAAESLLVLPAAVKSPGQDTLFSTKLTIENTSELTSGKVTLTYHYVDTTTGEARVANSAEEEIAPRAIKTYTDVIGEAFGMTAETPTYGWISIRTLPGTESAVPQMAAEALISALVDPADPSKGEKQTRVAALESGAPEWTDKSNTDGERQLPGLEETVERRTNFHVVEVAGKTCRVQVRAVDKNGDVVGTPREYDIAPNQYFQMTKIFSSPAPGLDLGDRAWDGLTILMKVLEGDGRVLAFATLNDNLSKQPEVLVLSPPKRRGAR